MAVTGLLVSFWNMTILGLHSPVVWQAQIVVYAALLLPLC